MVDEDFVKSVLRKNHLSQYSFSRVEGGFVNEVFFVGDVAVLRVAPSLYPRVKTRHELAVVKFLSEKTSIPVPVMYDARSESSPEFILMSRLAGRPLSELFWVSPRSQQTRYMRDLGLLLREMHSFSFDKIGQFTRGDMFVSRMVEYDAGPFSSFAAWAAYDIEFRASQLFEQGVFLDLVSPLRDYARRLRGFRDDAPFVLCHGDFESKNVLVCDGYLSGVLDFEWGGAFPVHVDLFHVQEDFCFAKNPFLRVAFEDAYGSRLADSISPRVAHVYEVMGLSMTLGAYKNWFSDVGEASVFAQERYEALKRVLMSSPD